MNKYLQLTEVFHIEICKVFLVKRISTFLVLSTGVLRIVYLSLSELYIEQKAERDIQILAPRARALDSNTSRSRMAIWIIQIYDDHS